MAFSPKMWYPQTKSPWPPYPSERAITGTAPLIFPLEYEEVAKIIKAGYTYAHDIGKMTYYDNGDTKTRYFLNAAGMGLDEMVCHSTNLMKQ